MMHDDLLAVAWSILTQVCVVWVAESDVEAEISEEGIAQDERHGERRGV